MSNGAILGAIGSLSSTLAGMAGAAGTPLSAKGNYDPNTTYASGDFVVDPNTFTVRRAKQAAPAGSHGRIAYNGQYLGTWSGQNNSTGTTAASATVPAATVTTGDLLIAVIAGGTAADADPTMPGWTKIGATVDMLPGGANATGEKRTFWYRTAVAGDAAGFTVTTPALGNSMIGVRAYRNIYYFNPAEFKFQQIGAGAGTLAVGGTNTTPPSASVYPTGVAMTRWELWIVNTITSGSASSNTITTSTIPTGYINRGNSTGYNGDATVAGWNQFAAYDYVVTSTAGPTPSFTSANISQTFTSAALEGFGVLQLNLYHDGYTGFVYDPAYWDVVSLSDYIAADTLQVTAKGTYSTTTTYKFRDVVQYGGVAYMAVKDVTAGSHDISGVPSPAYWVRQAYLTARVISPPPSPGFIPSALMPSGLTLRYTYTTSQAGLSFPLIDWVYVVAVGGGGGGGNQSGGGGGACVQGWMRASLITSVVIGAGGSGVSPTGNPGGNTTVGPVIAYGGGAGTFNNLILTPSGPGAAFGGLGVAAGTSASPSWALATIGTTIYGLFTGGRPGAADQTGMQKGQDATSGAGSYTGAGGNGYQGPGGGGSSGAAIGNAGGTAQAPGGTLFLGGAVPSGSLAGGGGAGIIAPGSDVASAGQTSGAGGGLGGGGGGGGNGVTGGNGGGGAVLIYW